MHQQVWQNTMNQQNTENFTILYHTKCELFFPAFDSLEIHLQDTKTILLQANKKDFLKATSNLKGINLKTTKDNQPNPPPPKKTKQTKQRNERLCDNFFVMLHSVWEGADFSCVPSMCHTQAYNNAMNFVQFNSISQVTKVGGENGEGKYSVHVYIAKRQ